MGTDKRTTPKTSITTKRVIRTVKGKRGYYTKVVFNDFTGYYKWNKKNNNTTNKIKFQQRLSKQKKKTKIEKRKKRQKERIVKKEEDTRTNVKVIEFWIYGCAFDEDRNYPVSLDISGKFIVPQSMPLKLLNKEFAQKLMKRIIEKVGSKKVFESCKQIKYGFNVILASASIEDMGKVEARYSVLSMSGYTNLFDGTRHRVITLEDNQMLEFSIEDFDEIIEYVSVI